MQRRISFFEEIRERSDTGFTWIIEENWSTEGERDCIPPYPQEDSARIFFEDPSSGHATRYSILLEKKRNEYREVPPLHEYGMVFESLVQGNDVEKRGKVFKVYQEIFQKSDRDIILTIEEFIRSDLGQSRTAAKRYIHREPLAYRLDRNEKHFSLDIRKFKDAIIIDTALLTWKEKQTNENRHHHFCRTGEQRPGEDKHRGCRGHPACHFDNHHRTQQWREECGSCRDR